MSFGPIVVETVVIFALTLFAVNRYGDLRRQNVLTSVFVIVTWFLSFWIIFLLPIDISATLYEQCYKMQYANGSSKKFLGNGSGMCTKPWSYVDRNVLKQIWNVVYWSTQLLTWIILPFLQSYVTAAHFTIQRKILAMLKENAIVYGSLGLIFGILLIYVVIKGGLNSDSFNGIVVAASNTWGLLILVLLLGYGLVDVPLSVWNSSRVRRTLAHMYFKVAKLRSDMEDAKLKLDEVYEDVRKVAQTVKYRDPLRKHVDTILKKCPEGLISRADRGVDDFEDFDDGDKGGEYPTVSKLVTIHKKVITATRDTKRTKAQWEILVDKTMDLEDVEDQRSSSGYRFRGSLGSSSKIWRKCPTLKQTLDWWWKIKILPVVLMILAVLFGLISLCVVWSEASFFSTDPVLSVFALLVNATGATGQHFVITEAICIFSIGYVAVCAYYTIFCIRIFNYYYLVPHHTDENSLLFCAMFLSRLTAPLCLNFVGIIHLDSHLTGSGNTSTLETETAFTEVMGHMDLIPFIAKKFNVYFPCCLILLCLATICRLGSRILHCFGAQQFFEDDEMSADYVSEGKEFIKIERRRRGVGGGGGQGSKDVERSKRSSSRLLNRSSTSAPVELTTIKFSRRNRDGDRLELIPSHDEYDSGGDGGSGAASRRAKDLVSRGVFDDM
ncbi:G-protein coupled receptor-associated protein LMBRD2-like [Oscarella lobularis]|uniref:G-protein coupled receptor-associated protein LMBRD2-like n=1 Tax=Oscarella lobularis TaxID=121494 RepID=UPI00331389CD